MYKMVESQTALSFGKVIKLPFMHNPSAVLLIL
jgi:hypothetical protein